MRGVSLEERLHRRHGSRRYFRAGDLACAQSKPMQPRLKSRVMLGSVTRTGLATPHLIAIIMADGSAFEGFLDRSLG